MKLVLNVFLIFNFQTMNIYCENDFVMVIVILIVLGAGGNTFNEIRRQRQSQPLKTMRMKNFLAPTDLMPLTLRISKAGNISVSITGQPPFISAMDPNVLDIKYISFRFGKHTSFFDKIIDNLFVEFNPFIIVLGGLPKESGSTIVRMI